MNPPHARASLVGKGSLGVLDTAAYQQGLTDEGQPTPVFLPGESQGRGSLVGCRLWGLTESDTTEATQQQRHAAGPPGGGHPLGVTIWGPQRPRRGLRLGAAGGLVAEGKGMDDLREVPGGAEGLKGTILST